MWKMLLQGHKLSIVADALRADPTAPLSVFSTSTVHSSVSSPSLPMSMKRWTVESERLIKSHYLGESF